MKLKTYIHNEMVAVWWLHGPHAKLVDSAYWNFAKNLHDETFCIWLTKWTEAEKGLSPYTDVQ